MKPEYRFGIDQRSPEWFGLRAGIATASRFNDVLSKPSGQTYRSYLHRVVAEAVTGMVEETPTTKAMQRGIDLEPKIRSLYEFHSGNSVSLVSFVGNGVAGCSPDGLIGQDGLFEAKSKAHHLMTPILTKQSTGKEFAAQVQGQLWVTGREWCDLVTYSDGYGSLIERVERDDVMIDRIAVAVIQFNRERDRMVEAIRNRSFNSLDPAA